MVLISTILANLVTYFYFAKTMLSCIIKPIMHHFCSTSTENIVFQTKHFFSCKFIFVGSWKKCQKCLESEKLLRLRYISVMEKSPLFCAWKRKKRYFSFIYMSLTFRIVHKKRNLFKREWLPA